MQRSRKDPPLTPTTTPVICGTGVYHPPKKKKGESLSNPDLGLMYKVHQFRIRNLQHPRLLERSCPSKRGTNSVVAAIPYINQDNQVDLIFGNNGSTICNISFNRLGSTRCYKQKKKTDRHYGAASKCDCRGHHFGHSCAEQEAITKATNLRPGDTLYCNMSPCSNCVDAIIACGFISRVVYTLTYLSTEVERLRHAGIQTIQLTPANFPPSKTPAYIREYLHNLRIGFPGKPKIQTHLDKSKITAISKVLFHPDSVSSTDLTDLYTTDIHLPKKKQHPVPLETVQVCTFSQPGFPLSKRINLLLSLRVKVNQSFLPVNSVIFEELLEKLYFTYDLGLDQQFGFYSSTSLEVKTPVSVSAANTLATD